MSVGETESLGDKIAVFEVVVLIEIVVDNDTELVNVDVLLELSHAKIITSTKRALLGPIFCQKKKKNRNVTPSQSSKYAFELNTSKTNCKARVKNLISNFILALSPKSHSSEAVEL